MSKMSDRERFEAALKMDAVDRVSLACPLQTGTVALMQASGAYWPDAHRDPEKMAKLALAAHEVARLESVCVPYHNEYESEAMGCVLGEWRTDMQPHVVDFAVKTLEDIDRMRVPDPKKDGELPVMLKAVSLLSKKVGDEVPVIPRICCPYELANRLCSVPETVRMVLDHPNELKKLMKIALETEKEYGRALIDAGATTITLLDSTASCITDREVGPKYYMEFAQPYERELISKLDTFTVLHICDDMTIILEQMAETGVTGISIDSSVDAAEAKKVLGGKAAVIGNINALNILGGGTPEKVKEKAREALEKGVDVLTSSCGFPAQTPLENMKALVEAGLEFHR